jgi:hypothetical protein
MAESAPVAGAAVVADSLATGSAAAPGEATEEQREARDDLLDERDDERDDLAQMRPRIVREKVFLLGWMYFLVLSSGVVLALMLAAAL